MRSPPRLGISHRLAAVALVLVLALSAATAAEARLLVRIRDADGKLTPARAWVDDANGTRHFAPLAPASCTPYPRDRSFSCDGWFEMQVPAGRMVVHVERGKEHVPVDHAVEVGEGQRREIELTLTRWINMPARGWYSADMHVHFGQDRIELLRQLSLADDVHLVPAFTYWLRGREPGWKTAWPEWEGGPVVRIDAHHVITRTNLEIERISPRELPGRSVGASFVFNLARPISTPRFDMRFPTDTALGLAAQREFPECVIDTDKPSWADHAVGVALGVYDVAQVCHNHFHRLVTKPGGWGMIGPLAANERELTEKDELLHRTNTQYYHWLNCGLRLGVSGGSAMGVMAVPLGYNRTYARIAGEFTPDTYWAAVKAGRTFATSGPMLTLTLGGLQVGATLEVSSPSRPIEVNVHLQSLDLVESVELIEHGAIVHRGRPEPPASGSSIDRTFTWTVQPKRSGWYAARALFRAPDGGLRQAHTSPIYVRLDGKPAAFRESAAYMLRWIDRLEEFAIEPDRYRAPADREAVLELYRKARDFYQRVSATAREHWGE